MGKKGVEDAAQTVKLMIPILIVLVVLLFLVKQFLWEGANLNAKNACKMSVLQQAATKSVTAKLPADLAQIPIKCPTEIITIKETEPEKIKAAVANKMYDCWDNFGKGKLNIFPSERLADEIFCVVCSSISFEKKGETVNGFMQYLVDNNAPLVSQSYYYDFNGVNPSTEEYNALASNPTDAINTDNKYGVLFAYGKRTLFWDRWTKAEVAGVGTAAVGGTLLTIGIASGFVTGGVGWIITGIAAASAGAYGWGFVHGGDMQSVYTGSVQLLPIDGTNKDDLQKINCTYIPEVI
jgi:hypothetical protein